MTISLRIVSGAYAPGQQLPSCAQCAVRVGANRNADNKAYRSLAGLHRPQFVSLVDSAPLAHLGRC